MATRARAPITDGPPPDEAPARARLRVLGPQWLAAAQDAFSGMAQSPERYMAAARLVAGRLERLRALPPGPGAGRAAGPDGDLRDGDDEAAASALVTAWDTREPAAGDLALPVTPAERNALTATAFAIRYGEVTDWLTLRDRRRAMAAAAAGSGGWVVLEESGHEAGDPFIAYRRLEVDCVTGLGVLVATRPDVGYTRAIHEVRLVSVAPLTGELNDDFPDSYWEFSSSKEREEHVAALRSRTGPAVS